MHAFSSDELGANFEKRCLKTFKKSWVFLNIQKIISTKFSGEWVDKFSQEKVENTATQKLHEVKCVRLHGCKYAHTPNSLIK